MGTSDSSTICRLHEGQKHFHEISESIFPDNVGNRKSFETWVENQTRPNVFYEVNAIGQTTMASIETIKERFSKYLEFNKPWCINADAETATTIKKHYVVDPNMTIAENAAANGVSKKAMEHFIYNNNLPHRIAYATKNFIIDTNLTIAENAKVNGTSYGSMAQYLSCHNIHCRRSKKYVVDPNMTIAENAKVNGISIEKMCQYISNNKLAYNKNQTRTSQDNSVAQQPIEVNPIAQPLQVEPKPSVAVTDNTENVILSLIPSIKTIDSIVKIKKALDEREEVIYAENEKIQKAQRLVNEIFGCKTMGLTATEIAQQIASKL